MLQKKIRKIEHNGREIMNLSLLCSFGNLCKPRREFLAMQNTIRHSGFTIHSNEGLKLETSVFWWLIDLVADSLR